MADTSTVLRTVMDAAAMQAALAGITRHVLDSARGTARLALVGIVTRGETLARRVRAAVEADLGRAIDFGVIDISLYRDDRAITRAKPLVRGTELTFDVDGARIVLIDDVCFTGRTVRAAIDQVIDFGRPRAIELCTLVDRGHRELPIRPDYAGLVLDTSADEKVQVRVAEIDGEDSVTVH